MNLKLSLMGAILALSAACIPARTPNKEAASEDLKQKTVALVDIDPESPMQVAAYCTGVWVSEHSILTANHCTQGGDELLYVVADDIYRPGSYTARAPKVVRTAFLLVRDEHHDLALLKTYSEPEHSVAKVSHSWPKAGEFSQEMGMSLGLWWSYSSGDVAAIRREPTATTGEEILMVQSTTPTSGGNSGGGLFDENDELIGLCHGGYRNGQNVNLFIHPSYISAFLNTPESKGL